MRDARPGTTPPKPKQRARRGAGAVGAQMGRPARSVRPSRDPSLRAAQGSFSREQAAARAALAHPHHTHVLRSLDTGASYVVGTRPSQIPHNVVQGVESIVPGTHAYSEAHHSRAWAMAHPEALRQTEHNVGIVPWGPFKSLGKVMHPKLEKDLLDAAAQHHTNLIHQGETPVVGDTAKLFNVPARKLKKRLKTVAPQHERIHSNGDPQTGRTAAEVKQSELGQKYNGHTLEDLNRIEAEHKAAQQGAKAAGDTNGELAALREIADVRARKTELVNGADPHVMPPEVEASARKVRAALSFGGAKKAYAAQEELRTVERGKRAGAMEEAIRGSNPADLEGMISAGTSRLRGPLPKGEFTAVRDRLDAQDITNLSTYLRDTPKLQPFQRLHSLEAFAQALRGETLAPYQVRALHDAFGKDLATSLIEAAPHIKASLGHELIAIANIPRSLMASFDLSAPFRQALVAGARHPKMLIKNFKPMLEAFKSEESYHALQDEIHSRPNAPLYHQHKLATTELGTNLTDREEQFYGDFFELHPKIKKASVVGIGVHASGRAYTAFLAKMRADMFDYLYESLVQAHGLEHDSELADGIARYVNAATGRGSLGKLTTSAQHLNTLFFSPRLLASRFNFLDVRGIYGGGFYGNLPKPVRMEALRSMAQLAGATSAILTLAAWGGAKVGLDPRNADWAKIKIGQHAHRHPRRLPATRPPGSPAHHRQGDQLHHGGSAHARAWLRQA
jgi:hypothetical protein